MPIRVFKACHPVTFSASGQQYVAVTTGEGCCSPEQKPSIMLGEVHRPGTGAQIYLFALPSQHAQ